MEAYEGGRLKRMLWKLSKEWEGETFGKIREKLWRNKKLDIVIKLSNNISVSSIQSCIVVTRNLKINLKSSDFRVSIKMTTFDFSIAH